MPRNALISNCYHHIERMKLIIQQMNNNKNNISVDEWTSQDLASETSKTRWCICWFLQKRNISQLFGNLHYHHSHCVHGREARPFYSILCIKQTMKHIRLCLSLLPFIWQFCLLVGPLCLHIWMNMFISFFLFSAVFVYSVAL